MSTNFYLVKGKATYHLGKRSAGWQFMFKASEGIHDLRSWYKVAKKLEDSGWKLTNDNNSNEKDMKELLKEILRLVKTDGKQHRSVTFYDAHGHSFYDGEFG